jgi:hypothetical protein
MSDSEVIQLGIVRISTGFSKAMASVAGTTLISSGLRKRQFCVALRPLERNYNSSRMLWVLGKFMCPSDLR